MFTLDDYCWGVIAFIAASGIDAHPGWPIGVMGPDHYETTEQISIFIKSKQLLSPLAEKKKSESFSPYRF